MEESSVCISLHALLPLVQVDESEVEEEREEELSEEQQEARALTLAARFSQAVAELQFVGVCRPSQRRGAGAASATMQRTYYPPETIPA